MKTQLSQRSSEKLSDSVEINSVVYTFGFLLEDPFEQLSGIVKNVDRHGKTAFFLIMTDSCLKIIQAKIKVVRRKKSVNNSPISYRISANLTQPLYLTA
mgnify:CR=1 FL=1